MARRKYKKLRASDKKSGRLCAVDSLVDLELDELFRNDPVVRIKPYHRAAVAFSELTPKEQSRFFFQMVRQRFSLLDGLSTMLRELPLEERREVAAIARVHADGAELSEGSRFGGGVEEQYFDIRKVSELEALEAELRRRGYEIVRGKPVKRGDLGPVATTAKGVCDGG